MGLFEGSNGYDDNDSANPDKNPEVQGDNRRRRDPYKDPWKKSPFSPYSDSVFNHVNGTGPAWQDPNRFDPEIQIENSPNGFAKAAVVCGIASLLFLSSGISFFFAAFGILFALLARRRKFSQMASFGLGLSISGIVIFVCIIVIALATLKADGTLDYAIREAQQTDFSNETEVQEFENNLFDRLMSGAEDSAE